MAIYTATGEASHVYSISLNLTLTLTHGSVYKVWCKNRGEPLFLIFSILIYVWLKTITDDLTSFDMGLWESRDAAKNQCSWMLGYWLCIKLSTCSGVVHADIRLPDTDKKTRLPSNLKRCLHVRTGTQYWYCVPVCNTSIAYRYAIPVRTCKQTGDMYAIHVRRFKHV